MEKQFLSKSPTEFRQIWKWYSQGNRPQLKAWAFNVLFTKGMITPFCHFAYFTGISWCCWPQPLQLALPITCRRRGCLFLELLVRIIDVSINEWGNFVVENSNQIVNGGRQSVSGQRRDHEIAQLHSEHLLLVTKLQDFAFCLRVEHLEVEEFIYRYAHICNVVINGHKVQPSLIS